MHLMRQPREILWTSPKDTSEGLEALLVESIAQGHCSPSEKKPFRDQVPYKPGGHILEGNILPDTPYSLKILPHEYFGGKTLYIRGFPSDMRNSKVGQEAKFILMVYLYDEYALAQ